MNLEKLNLAGNELNDLEPLAQLKFLKELDLSDNYMCDTLNC